MFFLEILDYKMKGGLLLPHKVVHPVLVNLVSMVINHQIEHHSFTSLKTHMLTFYKVYMYHFTFLFISFFQPKANNTNNVCENLICYFEEDASLKLYTQMLKFMHCSLKS